MGGVYGRGGPGPVEGGVLRLGAVYCWWSVVFKALTFFNTLSLHAKKERCPFLLFNRDLFVLLRSLLTRGWALPLPPGAASLVVCVLFTH